MWRKVLFIALVGYATAYPMDVEGTIEAQQDAINHARRAMLAAHNLKRAGGWTAVADGASAIVDPVPIAGPVLNGALHTAGAVLDTTQAVLENIPIVGPLGGAVLDTAGHLIGGVGQTVGGITQGILGNNGLLGGILGGNGGLLGGVLGGGAAVHGGYGAQGGLLGGLPLLGR